MRDIEDMPQALIDALVEKPHDNGRQLAESRPMNTISKSRYAAAALTDELSKLKQAQNGQRNDQLNRSAYSLGQLVGAGTLDRGTVEHELEAAANAIGLRELEASKTIRSGLESGIKSPRVIPDASRNNGSKPHSNSDDQSKKNDERKPATPTDDELRDRLLRQFPDLAYGLGEFRQYAEGIYPVMDLDTLRQNGMTVLETAKPEGVRPSARLLGSVMELARIQVAVPAARWDAMLDLLPCRNGALNIKTLDLLPHSPKHYFTSALDFDYDPLAKAPAWEWFIAATLPDAGDFLQEFAGYAATAETRHELAVWLFGPPGSGKSTFLLGLETMLGQRAGLLNLGDVEHGHFGLANLPGKTLMVSTEQPGDYIASGGRLNAIISGEPVTVDRKFKDAIEIVSRAKLCWAMNSLPRVGDSNSGLFRRVKVVKFPPLAEAKRDTKLKDYIAGEGAGILNWALAGLARLLDRGRFDVPSCIVDATEQFRQSNDIPAQFVAECCVIGTDKRAPAGQIYKAYKDWCFETGHKAQSSTSLATDWQRMGFERHRANGRAFWHGVGMMDTYM